MMGVIKRGAILFLCIAILIINIPVYAADITKYFYDGAWHEYQTAPTYLQVNGDKVETDMPPIIFSDRSVVPARAVFEKLGADVTWDGENKQVGIKMNDIEILLMINEKVAVVNNNEYEMEIPAKIINDRTMIPTRFVGETLGMNVDWVNDERLITIDYTPKTEEVEQNTVVVNNVNYIVEDSKLRINIVADSEIKDYSTFELNDHPRLVVDINHSILDIDHKEVEINDNKVLKIRSSQYEVEPNSTRYVVDLDEWTNYNVGLSDDRKELCIDFTSEDGNVTDVTFEKNDEINTVNIEMDFVQKPNVFRLSNPDRIVIDIPSSKLNISEKKDTINADIVKSIRYGQLDEDTSRIVVDVGGQPQFEVEETVEGIKLDFMTPTYKNVYYTNKEKPQLIIYSNNIVSNYTDKMEVGGNKYTLSVPTSDLDLGDGRLYINDNHFEFIDIVKNEQTETTDIIFTSKEPYTYLIVPQKNSSKTVIDAMVNAGGSGDSSGNVEVPDIEIRPEIRNKIVIVDAGHGGKDPGAIYFGVNEKDLNLDISLRLYNMLKEAGIKVYMTRNDDTYLNYWEERPGIANNLNASLFVSVHNNSMPNNSEFDGTMTLYYPSAYNSYYGISSGRFAEIIQDELISALGTTDRGIRERPKLAVLNKTKMPAVLAEIAFMSNMNDMQKLKTDEFRQKAAEALFAGIIKALNESVK